MHGQCYQGLYVKKGNNIQVFNIQGHLLPHDFTLSTTPGDWKANMKLVK